MAATARGEWNGGADQSEDEPARGHDSPMSARRTLVWDGAWLAHENLATSEAAQRIEAVQPCGAGVTTMRASASRSGAGMGAGRRAARSTKTCDSIPSATATSLEAVKMAIP